MSASSTKWLTTLDLENFIDKYADEETKQAFLGAFPLDCLPQRISPTQLPVLFIVNTNSSNLPGQHWKAVYVSKQRIGEVFDSLAVPVSLKLQQWLNEFTRKWSPSRLTLQNPLAATCGGYVLYYVMCRLHFKSINSCLSPFTSNVFTNDDYVEEFFRQFAQ